MPEEKDDQSGFRVVDRRTFAADGTRKEDQPEQDRNLDDTPISGRSAPSELRAEPEERTYIGDEDASSFETLVSYLSTTAMLQLGMLAGPSGERIPADLPNARRTVDLLAVLKEKTQGNLTPDETKLLDDVLYELRMTYLEISNRQLKKSK